MSLFANGSPRILPLVMQRANTSGGYRSYHDLAGASSSAPLPIPSDLGAPLGWLAAYSLDVMNTADPGDSSPRAYLVSSRVEARRPSGSLMNPTGEGN